MIASKSTLTMWMSTWSWDTQPIGVDEFSISSVLKKLQNLQAAVAKEMLTYHIPNGRVCRSARFQGDKGTNTDRRCHGVFQPLELQGSMFTWPRLMPPYRYWRSAFWRLETC